MSSTAPDALVDTNNVWADQPSGGLVNSPSENGAIKKPSPPSLTQREFDEFDPFRPASAGEELDERLTDGVAAPPTPSKTSKAAPPVPEKQSNDSISPQMTPSSSSSGLFGNIAAAFKKREHFSGSPSSRIASPSKTSSAKQAATAILVPMRDGNDAAGAGIEDSERSAMPAVPSHGEGAAAHDGNDAETEGLDSPPFDFNLFLEQMRSRPAEPIARYLRSFLKEFAKRDWSVNEQIRVINDYLDFIAVKMRENEVWKGSMEREFDNAVEAMEKLVMNRVYHQTFVPALAPAAQASSQTDDLERDHVFSQRIKLFGWVSETHLDLPQTEDSPSFLEFAKQELLKVNNYKAPRDKLICVLNCCKVIFGLMRHLGTDDGADTFIPFLILVVIRANPPHLVSNVQYIQRFRNPDRLAGENGYYLSSLNAAISFIETLASSSLSNITEVEFADNVENAVRQIAEEQADAVTNLEHETVASLSTNGKQEEDASPPLLSAAKYGPTRLLSPAEATRDFFSRSSDNLQKTVSKPLQAIGKIFNDMGSDAELVAGVPAARPGKPPHDQPSQAGHTLVRQRSGSSIATQASNRPRRGYSLQYQQQQTQTPQSPLQHPNGAQSPFTPPRGTVPLTVHSPTPTRVGYNAADYLDDSIPAAQVQADADRQQAETFAAKISTLRSIFPDIEGETLEIVLISNGEDVERSIEGLLDMT